MNLLSLPQGWLDKTGTSVRSGWGGDTESARIRSYNGFYGGAYIQQSEHGLNLKAAYGIEPLAGEFPSSGKATYTAALPSIRMIGGHSPITLISAASRDTAISRTWVATVMSPCNRQPSGKSTKQTTLSMKSLNVSALPAAIVTGA